MERCCVIKHIERCILLMKQYGVFNRIGQPGRRLDISTVALLLACDFSFVLTQVGRFRRAVCRANPNQPNHRDWNQIEVGIEVEARVVPVEGRILRILGPVVRHDWLSDEGKRRAVCKATWLPLIGWLVACVEGWRCG